MAWSAEVEQKFPGNVLEKLPALTAFLRGEKQNTMIQISYESTLDILKQLLW